MGQAGPGTPLKSHWECGLQPFTPSPEQLSGEKDGTLPARRVTPASVVGTRVGGESPGLSSRTPGWSRRSHVGPKALDRNPCILTMPRPCQASVSGVQAVGPQGAGVRRGHPGSWLLRPGRCSDSTLPQRSCSRPAGAHWPVHQHPVFQLIAPSVPACPTSLPPRPPEGAPSATAICFQGRTLGLSAPSTLHHRVSEFSVCCC